MSTQSGRKSHSVVDQLLKSPHAYSFFQAVRILERAGQMQDRNAAVGQRLGGNNAIAGFAPPSTEMIRLKAQQSFSFPEAEIHSITRRVRNTSDGGTASDSGSGKASPRWDIQVNFMGLTGSMGVMPFHYTELILQRLKLKDESLVHFLDLFNHRIISLFYRAASKYHLPLEYERKRIRPKLNKEYDLQTQTLLSFLGLGTSGLNNRLQVKDESLVYYSGLFTQQVRTASGLRQILQDYFAIPVKIQEFVGQWQELIPDIRSRLVSKSMPKGQNAQLGKSVMFGRKGWFAQGKIRIFLGPLDREQFNTFAPGTKSLKALNDMVRFYVGLETNYDFVIEVKRKDIPRKITLRKDARPLMGWNTWLSSSEEPNNDSNEILKITVSANRLK